MDSLSSQFVMSSLQFLSTLFVFAVGLVLLVVVVLYIVDVSQTGDAVRRNYPVLGRFRYLFSTLGEFFR
ncbi:MAG: FMN-binding glutamate synthase family protein, partial [Pseudomonadota bacterium]